MQLRRAGSSASSAPPPAPSPAPSSDTLRIAAIRQGDVRVFEQVYLERFTALVQFACRYVRDPAAAEEIVQDIFLAVWTGRETWTPASTIDAYLFGAVRNRALTTSQRAAREANLSPLEIQMSDAHVPDVGLLTAEQVRVISAAVRSLPERARDAVALRWGHSLTYAEIGQVLGVSEEAARKLILRTSEKLRELLAEYARET